MENGGFPDACKLIENFQGQTGSPRQRPKKEFVIFEGKTLIKRVSDLSTPALIRYVESRSIPISLARKLHYTRKTETTESNFYAVGFRNETGGFELRSEKFKGCIGSKDIRFLPGQSSLTNGCGVLILFEGFFDFLAFLAHKRLTHTPYDTIVLNSTSQLNRALPIISNYNSIVCYFDNDLAGERAYVKIIEETRITTINASAKYFPNYKDYNDFLCQQKA